MVDKATKIMMGIDRVYTKLEMCSHNVILKKKIVPSYNPDRDRKPIPTLVTVINKGKSVKVVDCSLNELMIMFGVGNTEKGALRFDMSAYNLTEDQMSSVTHVTYGSDDLLVLKKDRLRHYFGQVTKWRVFASKEVK